MLIVLTFIYSRASSDTLKELSADLMTDIEKEMEE